MDDEYVDVIDENNNVVRKELKSGVHKDGSSHRVSAVLLQGQDGRYLIPTAAGLKVEAGKLFHSAAGHVMSGESYIESAKRELYEETGVSAEKIKFIGSFWFKQEYAARKESERFEIFLAVYKPNMGKIKLNEEQVDERWLNSDELKKIYEEESDRISGPLRLTCKLLLRF